MTAPQIFVVTSVSFRDHTAGTIAMLALKKTTADVVENISNRASNMINENMYVDDLIDSFDNHAEAVQTTGDVDEVLSKGGKVKVFSDTKKDPATRR